MGTLKLEKFSGLRNWYKPTRKGAIIPPSTPSMCWTSKSTFPYSFTPNPEKGKK